MKKMIVILGIISGILAIAAGIFLVFPVFSDPTFFQNTLLSGILNSLIEIFTFQSAGIMNYVLFGSIVVAAVFLIAMWIVSIVKKRGAILGLSFVYLVIALISLLGLIYTLNVTPVFNANGISTEVSWLELVVFGVSLATYLAGICFAVVVMLLDSKSKVAKSQPVDLALQAASIPEENKETVVEEDEEEKEETKKEKHGKIHEVEEKVEIPEDLDEEQNVQEEKVEEKPEEKVEEKKEEEKVQEEKPEEKEEPKVEEQQPKVEKKKSIKKEKPEEKEEPKEESKTDKVYHVAKRAEDNKWTIKFAKGTKVIKTFNTKDEAVKYAYELAERQNARVAIHASKGKYKGKIRSIE